MINLDEDALICDLAETYHILDYRSHPVKLVAALSAGLRDDSRIKMRFFGVPAAQNTLLLAMIADRVEMFRYGFSSKKTDAPVSLVEMLYEGEKPKKKGVVGFNTAEQFEAALARIKGE